MYQESLNPGTEVTLLLCGRFGRSADLEALPLSQSECEALEAACRARGIAWEELPKAVEAPGEETKSLPVELGRLQRLLSRGAALALAVEAWTAMGLWVIGRGDAGYPDRLAASGGSGAPVLLYGAGDPALLERGGLAVVGSRDADEEALAFTREVAGACARQGVQVVSGGARGVDAAAMEAALRRDGTVVGVLADRLARAARDPLVREAIAEGRAAMVSPYSPESPFSVGNAMGRNRHIYLLADWALVVASAEGQGGTWAGALEALRAGVRPVFVRVAEGAPAGNQALLARGAHPWPEEALEGVAVRLSEASGPAADSLAIVSRRDRSESQLTFVFGG